VITHAHLAGLAAVVPLVLATAVRGENSRPPASGRDRLRVFWQEGEECRSFPSEVGAPGAKKAPASRGMVLNGMCLDRRGSVVAYDCAVPYGIPRARIAFRYGRLHWKQTMVPATITLELSAQGTCLVRKDLSFPATGGWGETPAEYGFVSADAGDIPAGRLTVKLTSTADDNSVTIDGFFLLPERVFVSQEELNSLLFSAISSRGYLGLRSGSPVIDQRAAPELGIGVRTFGGESVSLTVTATDADSNTRRLRLSRRVAEQEDGARTLFYRLPHTADGPLAVSVRCAAHGWSLTAPVYLAGRLLADADAGIRELTRFEEELRQGRWKAAERCLADVQHACEFSARTTEHLKVAAAAADGRSWRGRPPTPPRLVRDAVAAARRLSACVAQNTETMRRVRSGKDPYAGRTGEFRRAFRSAATGDIIPYRVLVPTSYESGRLVPFILMLHGAGGDENQLSELDNGELPAIGEKAGYLLAFPKYHSRTQPSYLADLTQLVDLLCREYPKIDQSRIFATGVSMGGFTSFALARTYPEVFAAVCCVSGSGRPEDAAQVKGVPVFLIHGGLDTVVPPSNATEMAAQLAALGLPHELRIFPSHGHDYKPEYLTLAMEFFSRHRKQGVR